MATGDLFEWADASARAALAPRVPESELQRRFEAFHAENPRVYQTLVRLAREARAAGKERIGIAMLYEVTRWQLSLQTTDEEFKINNSYRSRYARLIMATEPDLQGVFETREIRA